MDIHEYLNNDYFLLTLTFGVYFLAKLVRKMLQLPVFNPILVSIAFMICFLTIADIDYETYKLSGSKLLAQARRGVARCSAIQAAPLHKA